MKGVLVIAALVAVSAGALTNGCPKELSTTLLPDFKDCAGFWKCADGVPLFQSCPEGLHFSDRLQRCTLPVFARCQAVDGDAPIPATLTSILDTIRNVISRKAQPEPPVEDELSAPPELPTGDLPDEEDTFRRFPDPDAEAPELPDEPDVADGETEDAEKSPKEQNSAVEEELDTMEEVEQDDGKEEEQDESERSEEKIDEEEDEVDSDKEEPEEKAEETSDVEDVVAENDGEIRQDSKKDVTVVKKDEEEEDEHKKKSKDVKSIEKESKKNKSEEKEKDSESEAESDDEE